MTKLTLFTIVGTRPELIRLSRLIPRLDDEFNHVLIHTGQNFDKNLSEIFFEELGIRRPDHFLDVNSVSLAQVFADVLTKTERLIQDLKPHGVLILGDTNSSIAALIAKRMQVAVYHWEAGNRSFDSNVPEEINRKVIDHLADINFPYSKFAMNNLIDEGIKAERIFMTGSPMKEVLDFYEPQIRASKVLLRERLEKKKYFLVSLHRQENVDLKYRLVKIMEGIQSIQSKWNFPVIFSTHPRTRARINDFELSYDENLIRFCEPFGFFDYMKLQKHAFCVISDSGTISEESAIWAFPAITPRESMERQEALIAGTIQKTGIEPASMVAGVEVAIDQSQSKAPEEYLIPAASDLVLSTIKATLGNFESWSGIRRII